MVFLFIAPLSWNDDFKLLSFDIINHFISDTVSLMIFFVRNYRQKGHVKIVLYRQIRDY